MKSCSEKHLEITWDEKECSWCPVCLLKQSQDHLRGESYKYKNSLNEMKRKYEPQITFGGETIEGLFFHDWTLNGISTQWKPIDYCKKASIVRG